ncbi:nucleoside hydrolase-like domain-containing protein [Novipirellula artificiosorum]|nr:nucleoside hydrolase-like domain-containing protein [Novipirellula artificiosorum]
MNQRTSRYFNSLSGFLVSLLVFFDAGKLAAQEQQQPDDNRLRVIVTSDFPPFPVTNSDPDDVQSMVRFLLYSNEFDVEGLIASAGTYGMVAEKKNILAVLDEYDKVDENLRKHDPKYPTADAMDLCVRFTLRRQSRALESSKGIRRHSFT